MKSMTRSLAMVLTTTLMLTSPVWSKDLAPNFNLRSPEGEVLNLKTMLEDGPVLLDFWATWCKPCIKAMPKIQSIYEEYGEKGLSVVGVNEDGPRGQSKVKPFLRARKLTFKIGLDSDGSLMRRMRVDALPTTILIDRSGEIVYRQAGFDKGSEAALVKAVQDVLGITASAKPEGADSE